MSPLERLVHDLGHPGMPAELAALLGCLAVAFGLCWAASRRRSAESVWFGKLVVDGLLFPLVALALTYAAMKALQLWQPVVLLRLAVPVLMALAGIRFIARVLTVAFPMSALARAAERIFSWVAWIATALWVIGILPAVRAEMDTIHFTMGKSRPSLLALVEGSLSAGALLIGALWISAVLERQVLRQAVHDLSLRKVAANVVRASLLMVGFLFALSAVGVDITALSVLGGALGVGLGFGLQKLAANYVSGFVILFERSLRIGDVVKVDSFEGTVVDIKTRYTLIRSVNGRESIVPNEKLISERIENLSLVDPKMQLTTEIAVGYGSDADEVRRLLVAAAVGAPGVMEEPSPVARLVKFGADGLEFHVQYWIGKPSTQADVRSEVNLTLLRSLREAGIDIPYPQRVVHIQPAPAAVSEPSMAAIG